MGKYDLKALLGELEKTETSSGNNDYQSDFWKPTIEKGEERVEYVIRFLPNPDSKTNFPWVERAAHMFSFASGKFIYEPCQKKTKKEPCYICEEVSKLYQSGDPSQETLGAKRFSKKRFFHNVLIVKDPREGGKNEGKVMIYECGQQIYDKCIEFLRNEDLEPEERIYFHPTVGTDFKLVITWKSNFQNYEKSDFLRKPSSIEVDGKELDGDAAETFIDEKANKLNERLVGDKVFKDYETLKELYLNQGQVSDKKKSPPKVEKEEEEIDEDIDDVVEEKTVKAAKPAKKAEPKPEVDEDEPPFDTDEDTDEDAELEALLGDD
jgi:hypothetical protein